MKKLIVLGIILLATSVMATPFLVSDPNATATFYKLKNVSTAGTENTTCPAQADGSLKTDVAGVPIGLNTVTVSACISSPAWGEACSAEVVFPFTRPAPPATTSNIRLIP